MSLVPIVVPEAVDSLEGWIQQAAWQENSINFAMRMAQVERQGDLYCRSSLMLFGLVMPARGRVLKLLHVGPIVNR